MIFGTNFGIKKYFELERLMKQHFQYEVKKKISGIFFFSSSHMANNNVWLPSFLPHLH